MLDFRGNPLKIAVFAWWQNREISAQPPFSFKQSQFRRARRRRLNLAVQKPPTYNMACRDGTKP